MTKKLDPVVESFAADIYNAEERAFGPKNLKWERLRSISKRHYRQIAEALIELGYRWDAPVVEKPPIRQNDSFIDWEKVGRTSTLSIWAGQNAESKVVYCATSRKDRPEDMKIYATIEEIPGATPYHPVEHKQPSSLVRMDGKLATSAKTFEGYGAGIGWLAILNDPLMDAEAAVAALMASVSEVFAEDPFRSVVVDFEQVLERELVKLGLSSKMALRLQTELTGGLLHFCETNIPGFRYVDTEGDFDVSFLLNVYGILSDIMKPTYGQSAWALEEILYRYTIGIHHGHIEFSSERHASILSSYKALAKACVEKYHPEDTRFLDGRAEDFVIAQRDAIAYNAALKAGFPKDGAV